MLILAGIAGAMVCVALFAGYQQRNCVAQTTLTNAFGWGIGAILLWAVSLFAAATASFTHLTSSHLDQLWYATAVVSTCPLISVLGARRPTNRVWNGFIILPLIAVLWWPALTLFRSWPDLPPLELQLPVYIGFVLVLIMGVGNYLGTRFGMGAFLFGIALVLLLLPFSSMVELSNSTTHLLRSLGGIAIALATASAIQQGHREVAEESPFDRIWFDFRDTFGIVWSIRIQERINQTAETENWPVRLGPIGFHWESENTSAEDKEQTRKKMEQTIRWLFRRFVEPEWIDARLNAVSTNNEAEHSTTQSEYETEGSN